MEDPILKSVLTLVDFPGVAAEQWNHISKLFSLSGSDLHFNFVNSFLSFGLSLSRLLSILVVF